MFWKTVLGKVLPETQKPPIGWLGLEDFFNEKGVRGKTNGGAYAQGQEPKAKSQELFFPLLIYALKSRFPGHVFRTLFLRPITLPPWLSIIVWHRTGGSSPLFLACRG